MLTVPAPITAEATGPGGAPVSYTVTATDAVSGNLTPSCAPPSGGTFPFGTTTVSCTAADGAGNKASGQFTVTVKDTVPPAITIATLDVRVEATGADGASVTYALPTALDTVDGPVPVSCAPKPGGRFPLGRTSVNCASTDSHSNTSSASFSVDVVDTTPPVLTVPAPITVSSQGGSTVAATDSTIAAFLNGSTARDIVSGQLNATSDAPTVFPLGTTTVTFSAQDAAGNGVSAKSTVTVVTGPVAPSKPVDRTPPDDVRGLTAKVADHQLTLRWQPPHASDYDHVQVARSSTQPGATQTVIYSGSSTSLTDRRLKNGTDYRYVVVAYDHAGNRSAGVALVAAPKATLLARPADGAKVTSAPTLLWVPVSGASYYNVQLFRGTQKIFSAWPATDKLKLTPTWTYGRRLFRLSPGTYRWFVFPGFGAREDAKYGPLLGQSTFVVVRGKK